MVLRADRMERSMEITLETHINNAIKSSDFCIVDITSMNPNVMYELGFATALNKPLLLIKEVIYDQIPSNLISMLITNYDRNNLSKFKEDLLNTCTYLIKHIESTRLQEFNNQLEYTVTCFPKYDVLDIKNSINSAIKNIDIMETNLSVLCTNYVKEIENALNNNSCLKIRIVTLDPESSFVNFKARRLGIDIYHYRNELRNSINKILNLMNPYGNRFELRIYDDIPVPKTYFIDDLIYSSFMEYVSTQVLTFKIDMHRLGVMETFVMMFDSIWHSSFFIRSF
ncbi:MAG: nucleoside 2-deoxyribosyltransferase [Bacteroidales bacterium]|nr:nucleoside 2-deoxyribosyltransferase [Bacteroidales bacterium]